MPTPEFVLELRRHVGHAPLPIVGVTAVILDSDQVLMGRRSDTGAWAPISGIVDPGEEPAATARREALEEAGVEIRVERLVSVHQVPRITHVNGDQVDYLDIAFRCTWVSGAPWPADGELTELRWLPLEQALAAASAGKRRAIELAVAGPAEAFFEA
ncbi:NUDIX domain-containing protein [Microbacterium sp. LRZ72]|uniref:NUDIX hydrolase n=1 Tax=Microbacterium sp. LRZ72 TaxID=2942481 RepID=UPI0029B84BE1|nr:NUDIX domain-containing protein [Microbacterium sp. LRZ72]MDX2377182.1 NUDIX domain-containing protein [Microbacterium sp. LRZ72]